MLARFMYIWPNSTELHKFGIFLPKLANLSKAATGLRQVGPSFGRVSAKLGKTRARSRLLEHRLDNFGAPVGQLRIGFAGSGSLSGMSGEPPFRHFRAVLRICARTGLYKAAGIATIAEQCGACLVVRNNCRVLWAAGETLGAPRRPTSQRLADESQRPADAWRQSGNRPIFLPARNPSCPHSRLATLALAASCSAPAPSARGTCAFYP